MARFLKEILLFILLALTALSLKAYFGYVPRNAFLSLSGAKHARLEQMPRPRIILSGGSNLLMGMDTGKLEDAFPDYHAVNMSLTIVLKPQFTLRDIEKDIQKNDVVVISFEYESLMGGKYFGQSSGVYLLETLERHPSSISALDWPQWKAIVSGSALEYAGIVNRESPIRLRNFRQSARTESELYLQSHFNLYGDAIFQLHETPKPDRSFGTLKDELDLIGIMETVDLLNQFVATCKLKEARCFLSFPPYPQSEYGKHQKLLDGIYEAIKDKTSMPILGTPKEMLFPDSMFWDTQYHLLQQGPQERTERLIQLLKPILRPEGSGKNQL